MKYDTITLTVADGTEEVEEIMTQFADRVRTVHKITCDSNADVELRAYRGGVLDIDLPADARPLSNNWLEYGEEFAPGAKFRIGFYNHSGASVTLQVSVQFTVE